MKRILYIILIVFSFSLFMINSYAINYINNVFKISLNGNTSIYNEEELIIDLDLNVKYTLSSLIGDLVYDKTKLQLTNCTSDYFVCTYTDKILLDSVEGVNGKKSIAKLTFKILEGFIPGDDSIIELKNINGDNNTVGNDSKVKIHKLQTDNNLKSLFIQNETLMPDFSPDITTYKIITNNKTINIEASSLSKIKNIGIKDLEYGNNIFEIVVTSETNAEKTYIINVFREKEEINNNDDNKQSNNEENNSNEQNSKNDDNKESNNNNTNAVKKETKNNNNKVSSTKLSKNKNVKFLKISDTDFVFNGNVFEYSIHLKNDIKKLNIDYELEDKKSKLVISGDTNLVKENNKIIISIIAEDGSQLDYVVNIIKETDNIVPIEKNIENNVDKTKDSSNNKISRFIFYLIPLAILIIIVIRIIITKSKKIYN